MQATIKKIQLPISPHTAIICGRTACGKTKFMLDLLESTNYNGKFENIVIICPTFKTNATYKEREWIKTLVHVDPGKELNKTLEGLYKKYKGERTLYIVDDCSALSDMKKKNNILSQLAFSGRHDEQSLWIITQRYNSILKDVRTQTQWVCMFHCKDNASFDECLNENDVVPREEKGDIRKKLRDAPHAKLILKTEYPYDYIVC